MAGRLSVMVRPGLPDNKYRNQGKLTMDSGIGVLGQYRGKTTSGTTLAWRQTGKKLGLEIVVRDKIKTDQAQNLLGDGWKENN